MMSIQTKYLMYALILVVSLLVSCIIYLSIIVAPSAPNYFLILSQTMQSIPMASTPSKEIATEILPAIRIYKDGTVERLIGSPFVPPDPTTNVSSKDVIISPHFSARLYLPQLTNHQKNLPILVYFHGGGFCIESAFSVAHHAYINSLVSESRAIAVSVEYRRAPEHVLPAAYEDCWNALQWVASHSLVNEHLEADAWIVDFGDFNRVYIGGDSAGANIVHNIALRAGTEPINNDVKIKGAFLAHPYFSGSKQLAKETHNPNDENNLGYKLWMLAYPSAPGGIDNPMINPFGANAPSLTGLGCARLLVCVAEKDKLRERGVGYYEGVKESGWNGEIELFEGLGEEHCYHVLKPGTLSTRDLIKRLASFIVV